jgi:dihydrodipicolinate synthase/N-acetylneuraminate lyase/uridine kinase
MLEGEEKCIQMGQRQPLLLIHSYILPFFILPFLQHLDIPALANHFSSFSILATTQEHYMDSKTTGHTHCSSRQSAAVILAQYITSQFGSSEKPVLIAIGGPGGSGKTTFSGKLQERLEQCGVVHLDNYKTSRAERKRKNLTGPHPDANQMALVADHLTKIKTGESISVPQYDSDSGETSHHEEYIPRQITIVEGEISTYKDFRHLIDCSIFIDSDFKTQLSARLGRDMSQRGHSLKKAVTTFLNSNLSEFTMYGAESKQWTDIHLFCHDNYHVSIEAVKNEMYAGFMEIISDLQAVDASGLLVPVATPFEKDYSLSQTTYIDHLSWLSHHGVSRLIVGGTTAEFFSLSLSERITLLKLSREYFPGYIMFNVSSPCITTALELTRRAQLYGADSLICLPPYYYANAPEEGIYTFLKTIADATWLPFYLYNFPKHTGNPFTPQLLAKIPHAGVKDSSADLSLITATSRYLLGGEVAVVKAYQLGAQGFVPGFPNIFPDFYNKLEMLLNDKKYDKATELLSRIAAFKRTLPKVSGIVAVKKMLGSFIENYPQTVRPPLSAAKMSGFTPDPELVEALTNVL